MCPRRTAVVLDAASVESVVRVVTGVLNVRGSHSVTVVPDSGSGELTGLAGTMQILIEGKKHSYLFDYTL